MAKGNDKKGGKGVSKLAQVRTISTKVLKKDDFIVPINQDGWTKPIPHIPTGSVILDYLVGGQLNAKGIAPCPGFPRKRVVNLYGQESSGKTTVALTAAAAVCAAGGDVGFIDWENAISVSYAKALGVPVDDEDKFLLVQPETSEEGMGLLWTMARAGVDLIVVDSVGAAVPVAMREQSIDEKGNFGRIGMAAQKWSYFLGELASVINRSGSCVLGISQLRASINTGFGGSKGPTTTAQGGNAWKFFSSVRIRLRRIKTEKGKIYNAILHKKEDGDVGIVVRAFVEKCKVSPNQGNYADFYIKFGEGIDDVRSIIEISSNHGIVKKGGAWYSWERRDGTTIRAQGIDAFKKELLSSKGAWSELYKAALDRMTSNQDKIEVASDDEDEIFDGEMMEKLIMDQDTAAGDESVDEE